MLLSQCCHNNKVVMLWYRLLNVNSELKPMQSEISINKFWKLLSLFSSETTRDVKLWKFKLVPKYEINFILVIKSCNWIFCLLIDSLGVVVLWGFLSLKISFLKHKTCLVTELAKYFQEISLSWMHHYLSI